LDRFSQEGVEGLKNRPKSGRHQDIPEEKIHEIKNELASNKQGWTTKQVEDLIIRKRRYKIPLYPHLQTHAQVGIQTESTTKSTCKHSVEGGKRAF
jgi:transposase